jgi:hypothetical protein
MLTKMEIARELEAEGLGRARQIANILDGLANLAASEIGQGEDFTVPGIVKVAYTYTPAVKKGERFLKGDTYVGFGGEEKVAEADSPARKAKIKLAARPAGHVARLKPGSKPEAQSAFLKSKAGRAVVRRKG